MWWLEGKERNGKRNNEGGVGFGENEGEECASDSSERSVREPEGRLIDSSSRVPRNEEEMEERHLG